jgi:hypothetical protein
MSLLRCSFGTDVPVVIPDVNLRTSCGEQRSFPVMVDGSASKGGDSQEQVRRYPSFRQKSSKISLSQMHEGFTLAIGVLELLLRALA